MIDVLRSQLLALKSQIDAMVAVIDSLQPSLPSSAEEPSGTCPHLETENIGTFGAPAFKCLACGRMVEQPVLG